MARAIESLAAMAVIGFARLVTGVRSNWRDCTPEPRPRVYFANHNSHGASVLSGTVWRPPFRRVTRPVAAADNWTVRPLRPSSAARVFPAVRIDRNPGTRKEDPIALMANELDAGSSLILFP